MKTPDKKDSRLQAALKNAVAQRGGQTELANYLNISQPYLSDLISGKKRPEKWERIADIAHKLGLNPLELMETPGFHFMPKDWIIKEMQIPAYTVSEFMARYETSGMESEKTPDGWPQRPGGKKMTPSGEDEERRVRIKLENNDYNPRYKERDELIVDPDVALKNGDVCMIILGDDLLLRQLVSLGDDEVQFCLPHDEFQQQVIKKGSLARFVIWGKVTGFFRSE